MEQDVATRLRSLRKQLGLEQSEMAARLLVSRSYLSQIENGREPGDKFAELLRRIEAEHVNPVNSHFAVTESPEPYGVDLDDIYAELHGVIDAAINAAGEDPERVTYLLDQLRQHLRIPAHWLAERPSKKAPATGIVVPKARSGAHREERATG